MTRTRSAVLMIYAALTPALVRANRKSSERRILATLILFRVAIEESFAKCGNVDYSWGADALASAHDYAVTMMLYVVYLCYAIAGIVVIVSALQIYIKMNTGEGRHQEEHHDAGGILPFPYRGDNRIPGIFRVSDLEIQVIRDTINKKSNN